LIFEKAEILSKQQIHLFSFNLQQRHFKFTKHLEANHAESNSKKDNIHYIHALLFQATCLQHNMIFACLLLGVISYHLIRGEYLSKFPCFFNEEKIPFFGPPGEEFPICKIII
jgi:hypothetical protein